MHLLRNEANDPITKSPSVLLSAAPSWNSALSVGSANARKQQQIALFKLTPGGSARASRLAMKRKFDLIRFVCSTAAHLAARLENMSGEHVFLHRGSAGNDITQPWSSVRAASELVRANGKTVVSILFLNKGPRVPVCSLARSCCFGLSSRWSWQRSEAAND